jgi:hypothetical protein
MKELVSVPPSAMVVESGFTGYGHRPGTLGHYVEGAKLLTNLDGLWRYHSLTL